MTPSATLLIVDDIPANIDVLAEALRADYRIKVATNGADALRLAADSPQPDLILLDVMMPGMDGFEVCRRLKDSAATHDIPVVFVTARDERSDEERGLDLGALDYIVKPFHLPVLRARVRNLVALKTRADLLESLAHLDALTGIPNRRSFDDTLQTEWRRCQRSGQPLALLMIDIDHFKAYNDHFGHGAGDRCLAAVAALLARNLARPGDAVTRYGGEEFAVILPETKLEGAVRIAERLREGVAALAIPHAPAAGTPIVTISVGCAAAIPDEGGSPAALFALADRKLYDAKAGGRNRICR
ncbi:MAG: diguanylate cyclase [Rhodocyclaceae bacterium]|nr:diguanylate cyclase [Rhodocyclaceae bacterium]